MEKGRGGIGLYFSLVANCQLIDENVLSVIQIGKIDHACFDVFICLIVFSFK